MHITSFIDFTNWLKGRQLKVTIVFIGIENREKFLVSYFSSLAVHVYFWLFTRFINQINGYFESYIAYKIKDKKV